MSPRRLHPDDIAHLGAADQQAAITKQRQEMNLKPWELCPLEVDDGPSPWPNGSAGAVNWGQAQRLRERMRRGQTR